MKKSDAEVLRDEVDALHKLMHDEGGFGMASWWGCVIRRLGRIKYFVDKAGVETSTPEDASPYEIEWVKTDQHCHCVRRIRGHWSDEPADRVTPYESDNKFTAAKNCPDCGGTGRKQ